MQQAIQAIANNPVTATSAAIVAAAAAITIWTTGALVSTLLYTPKLDLLGGGAPVAVADVNTAQIGERNFFGLAGKDGPVIQVDNLPETTLQLTLRGAFMATTSSIGGAIIEDEAKQAAHYTVGDELPGDAELKGVYADRIVLSRNGVLETLYFPSDDNASVGIGTRLPPGTSTTGSGPASRSSINLSPIEAEERRKAVRERIQKLRNK